MEVSGGATRRGAESPSLHVQEIKTPNQDDSNTNLGIPFEPICCSLDLALFRSRNNQFSGYLTRPHQLPIDCYLE